MNEILFGFISGIVAALGMGGGTILILLLDLFTDIKQHIIQGTNLIFFIPTSLIAIYINIKNKNINYSIAKWIIIFGILGSYIGANLSFKINNEKLKKYFGTFLVLIAIIQIYSFFKQYIKCKKENNK